MSAIQEENILQLGLPKEYYRENIAPLLNAFELFLRKPLGDYSCRRFNDYIISAAFLMSARLLNEKFELKQHAPARSDLYKHSVAPLILILRDTKISLEQGMHYVQCFGELIENGVYLTPEGLTVLDSHKEKFRQFTAEKFPVTANGKYMRIPRPLHPPGKRHHRLKRIELPSSARFSSGRAHAKGTRNSSPEPVA